MFLSFLSGSRLDPVYPRKTEMDTRFHCVYLLTSLDPQCEGAHYIGYTVNPIRRLRQHNGELVNGARRTKRNGRPWLLLMCVSGFGEDRIALKFEWCWQNPSKSTRLKSHVSQLRCVHKLTHAVGVLLLLLRTELFSRLQLTLHIFDREHFDKVISQLLSVLPTMEPLVETSLLRVESTTIEQFQTQYMNDGQWGAAVDCGAYFMRAPPGANVDVSKPIVGGQDNTLRCGVMHNNLCEEEVIRQHVKERTLLESGHYPCSLCSLPLRAPYFLRCSRTPFCRLRAHIVCLAMWFIYDSSQRGGDPLVKDAGPAEVAENSNDAACQVNENCYSLSGCEPVVGGIFNHDAYTDRRDDNSPPSPPCPLPTQSSQADASLAATSLPLVPRAPCDCPLCDEELQWSALVYDLKRRVAVEKRRAERERREAMDAEFAQRFQRLQSESNKKSTARERGALEGVRRKRRRRGEVAAKLTQQTAVRHEPTSGASGDRAHSAPPAPSCGGFDEIPANVTNPTAPLHADVLQVTEFNVDEWLNH